MKRKKIPDPNLAVNVIAATVSPERLDRLQTKLEQSWTIMESNAQAQIAALAREEMLGDMLHAGTLGYDAPYLTLSHSAGLTQGAPQTLGAGNRSVRPAFFPHPHPHPLPEGEGIDGREGGLDGYSAHGSGLG